IAGGCLCHASVALGKPINKKRSRSMRERFSFLVSQQKALENDSRALDFALYYLKRFSLS
ncbi:hypothetical protein, partial [Ruminococcus bromii]